MSRTSKEKIQQLLNQMATLASQTPQEPSIDTVVYLMQPSGCYCLILDRLDGNTVLEPTE